MKDSKYPNGYLPKIAYHLADGNHEAVAHFFERQVAAYGPITAENMTFITRESARLHRMWAREMQEFTSHLG